jgi:hypothetical protein
MAAEKPFLAKAADGAKNSENQICMITRKAKDAADNPTAANKKIGIRIPAWVMPGILAAALACGGCWNDISLEMAQRKLANCIKVLNCYSKKNKSQRKAAADAKPAISKMEQARLDSMLLDEAITNTFFCDSAGIETFLKAGADVDARDKFGNTPLIYAAARNPETCNLLIDNGADVNARNEYGETALITAASTCYGYTETCEILVENGADLNAADNCGNTPLMYAAAYGSIKTCAFLIKEYAKSGGDIKKLIAAKSNDGRTSLHHAAAIPALPGRTLICNLLIQKYAEAGGNVKKFIDMGDKEGRTALHYAAETVFGMNRKVYKFLVKNGADENAIDSSGATPQFLLGVEIYKWATR